MNIDNKRTWDEKRTKVPGAALFLAAGLSFAVPMTASAEGTDVTIDETTFPDDNFRTYVEENCDTDGDGSLSATEIKAVTGIDVSGWSITDLSGVENFTALKSLWCYENQLTELDVSQNTALRELYCSSITDLMLNDNLQYAKDNFEPKQAVDDYGNKYVEYSGDLPSEYFGQLRLYLPKNGWIQKDTSWYYFTEDVKATSWKKIGGKWYYFNAKGVMQTGWQKISGKWYYFNTSGAMQTGWQKISSKWYYFNTSGAMVTGWKTISGKTYFFKADGSMAAKEWCQGYWLNADGTWTYKPKASWKKDKKGWYFIDTKGWYAKSCTLTIDGKKYTFDAKGYLK